jgi:hypothetical protein
MERQMSSRGIFQTSTSPAPNKVLTVWTKRVINGRDEAIKFPDAVKAIVEGTSLVVYVKDPNSSGHYPTAAFNADQWLSWGFIERNATVTESEFIQDKLDAIESTYAFLSEGVDLNGDRWLHTADGRIITGDKPDAFPGKPVRVPRGFQAVTLGEDAEWKPLATQEDNK